MNNYEINNLYGYKEDYSYLNDVILKTLEHEGVKNSIFSIIFVSNEEIHKINKEYRGIDRVTDVISFAFEDNEQFLPDGVRILGDIYVAIPRMEEQATEYGHSKKRELSFLVCHGLLHLLGYDHTRSVEEEKLQFGIQDEILNSLNILR